MKEKSQQIELKNYRLCTKGLYQVLLKTLSSLEHLETGSY